MIGGRQALLGASGGVGPYGNWTGNYSDVSLLLRGDSTISQLSKYGGSCLVAGTTPSFTWGSNRIQVPAGPAFAYGTGDFTVEAWIYPTVASDGIFWNQAVSGTNYFICLIASDGSPAFIGTSSGGGSAIFGPAIPLNTWSHVAIVRRSGNVTIYSNGTGGSAVANSTNFSDTTFIPTIGSYTHNAGQLVFSGLIDDLRVTKGIARYETGTGANAGKMVFAGTNNLALPAAELPANVTDDPSYNSVSVLLRGSVSGSLTLLDDSPTPKTITVSGSATFGSPVVSIINDLSSTPKTIHAFGNVGTSTTTFKYGGSALVAGTSPNFTWGSNRIQVPAGPAFAYGTGDFTVEAWIYPTVASDGIFWNQAVSGTNYFMCQTGADRRPTFIFATSGGGTSAFGPVITLNQWSHVAIVRSAGQAKVYSNGVGGTAVACAQDFSDTTYIPTIGSYTHNAGQSVFSGLIDDLRVTKGIARYKKDFLPPPAQLPAI